jgi:hypothetical protein
VGRERAPHAERRSVRGPRRAAEPVAPRAAEPRRAAATGRAAGAMINFMLLVSRQGKTRLTKWYESYSTKEKARIVREVTARTGAGGPRARRAAPRARAARRSAPPPEPPPPRAPGDGARARAEDVQLHRVARRQEDRLQALREPLLHLLRRPAPRTGAAAPVARFRDGRASRALRATIARRAIGGDDGKTAAVGAREASGRRARAQASTPRTTS